MTALDLTHFVSWLATGERGISSEAIVSQLTGQRVGRPWGSDDHPRDLDDFRRCEVLLRAYPLARLVFPSSMPSRSPVWARLVERWDELAAQLESEVPEVFDRRPRGWRAPKASALMKALLAPTPDPAAAARRVAEHLTGFTYRWATETDLQEAMFGLLADSSFTVDREKRLDQRDRPDFLVGVDGHTVAVEVKVKGARSAILRQLGRYAEHDVVDAIVFASGLRALAAAMPAEIHGKPVISVHLESAL